MGNIIVDLAAHRRIHSPTSKAAPNGDEQAILDVLLRYNGGVIKCLHKGNLYFGTVISSVLNRKEGVVVVMTARDPTGNTFEVDFPVGRLTAELLDRESYFEEEPGRLYFPLSCLVNIKLTPPKKG